jgi:hypothetical protein
MELFWKTELPEFLILSKYSEDEECHGNAWFSAVLQTDLWRSDVTELVHVIILAECSDVARPDSSNER